MLTVAKLAFPVKQRRTAMGSGVTAHGGPSQTHWEAVVERSSKVRSKVNSQSGTSRNASVLKVRMSSIYCDVTTPRLGMRDRRVFIYYFLATCCIGRVPLVMWIMDTRLACGHVRVTSCEWTSNISLTARVWSKHKWQYLFIFIKGTSFARFKVPLYQNRMTAAINQNSPIPSGHYTITSNTKITTVYLTIVF